MMIITDKQRAVLAKFSDGQLLSPQAVMKLIPNLIKVEAINRIDELRDKGLLKKCNQTQFSITKKGLEALGLLPNEKPVTRVELDHPDSRPMTDAEMDRLLDGAVEELADELKETAPSVMTMEQFAEASPTPVPPTTFKGIAPYISLGDAQINLAADQVPDLVPKVHPALVAIAELEQQLAKPKPVQIDKLEIKKEVLVQLGRFLAQDICDVLIEIADDLDRAAGNEI